MTPLKLVSSLGRIGRQRIFIEIEADVKTKIMAPQQHFGGALQCRWSSELSRILTIQDGHECPQQFGEVAEQRRRPLPGESDQNGAEFEDSTQEPA